jgi:hypothetical protein
LPPRLKLVSLLPSDLEAGLRREQVDEVEENVERAHAREHRVSQGTMPGAGLTEVDPIGLRVEVLSGGLPDLSGHIPGLDHGITQDPARAV